MPPLTRRLVGARQRQPAIGHIERQLVEYDPPRLDAAVDRDLVELIEAVDRLLHAQPNLVGLTGVLIDLQRNALARNGNLRIRAHPVRQPLHIEYAQIQVDVEVVRVAARTFIQFHRPGDRCLSQNAVQFRHPPLITMLFQHPLQDKLGVENARTLQRFRCLRRRPGIEIDCALQSIEVDRIGHGSLEPQHAAS